MRRFMLIATAPILLAALIILLGCAPDTKAAAKAEAKAAPKQTEVSFFSGYTGPDGGVVKEIIAEFEKANPDIKVTVTTLQFTPLFGKFMVDMKAGSAPDILHLHPQEVAFFAEQSLLDQEMVAKMGLKKEDFNKTSWEGSFYKDKQWVVPVDNGAYLLYYNKKALKEAGFDKPPMTGKDLVEYARKLTVDKKGKNATQAGFDKANIERHGLGFPTNHFVFYVWYSLLKQQGDELFDPGQKKVAFSDAKAVKAFQFLQDLVFKQGVVPKGQKAPMDDFRAGKTAMVFDGNWQIPRLVSEPVAFEVDSVAFPLVFDKKGNWGSGSVFGFPVNKSRDAAKVEAAIKLSKAIVESPKYPATGHLAAWVKSLEATKALPYRTALIEAVDNLTILPNIVKSTTVYSATAPSPILTAPQDIMLNGADAAKAVKQLRADLEAVLNQ